jgi:hypothetical protein
MNTVTTPKFIQLSEVSSKLMALAEDGTVWVFSSIENAWKPLNMERK